MRRAICETKAYILFQIRVKVLSGANGFNSPSICSPLFKTSNLEFQNALEHLSDSESELYNSLE